MADGLRLPDFVIVGAQKAGTTSLYFALAEHPRVFAAEPKELDFFQDDTNYARGVEWYAAHFKDCPPGYIAGESSPEYLHYEHVAERMAEVIPRAKVIAILRNPIDRAYSGYWHGVRAAGEKLPFERAVEIEKERTANDPFALRYFSYVQRGQYAKQLAPFFAHFERSRILVLIAEEYFANPRRAISQAADFLSLSCDNDFLERASQVHLNKGVVPRVRSLQEFFPKIRWRFPRLARMWYRLNTKEKTAAVAMPPEVRAQLAGLYADSNKELAAMLGRDLSVWDEPAGKKSEP